jgi:hypothetical protein
MIYFDLNLLKLKNHLEKLLFFFLVKTFLLVKDYLLLLYKWRLFFLLFGFLLSLDNDIFSGNLLDISSFEAKVVYIYVSYYRWHSFRFKKNNLEVTRILS